MARLYELKNIVGVKDATANSAASAQQRHAMGPDFIQLSGEDATALGFMAHGGARLHLGHRQRRAAALRRVPGGLPRRRLCRARLNVQDRLMPLHDAIFVEPSPSPAQNTRLALLGRMAEEVRLPLVPVDGADARLRSARRWSMPA